MRPYIEPLKLAFIKKVLIESEKKTTGTRYILNDFLSQFKTGYLLTYLEEFNNKGNISITNIRYSRNFIEAERKEASQARIFSSLSSRYTPPKKLDKYLDLGEDLFKKVYDETYLTLKELIEIKDKLGTKFFDYTTSFEIEFHKEVMRRLKKDLREYVEDFMQGNLVAGMVRFYSYSVQKSAFERTIGGLAKLYGAKNLPA